MNKKRLAIVVGVSVLIFGGVLGFVAFRGYMIGQYFANMPQPVMTVTADKAVEETWEGLIPAVGTLRAINGVDISSEVAGIVATINFESGTMAQKSQMLLRMDTSVEEANLRSAQAELELARTSASRNRALTRSGTVSQAVMDRTEAELRVADAKLQAMRAQIEKKTIMAPFSGLLGVRLIDLGQYVQPGQVMVTLQDLSAMLMDFSISQKDLPKIKVGQRVQMTTDAHGTRVFEGQIQAIDARVDPQSGMLAVRAHFDNSDQSLRPGMFAVVHVVEENTSKSITVPASAISYNLYGDSVFVVEEKDGKQQVTRAYVEAGPRRGDRVAILKGVNPGDLVVTSGQVKLETGSLVEIRTDDPLSHIKTR